MKIGHDLRNHPMKRRTSAAALLAALLMSACMTPPHTPPVTLTKRQLTPAPIEQATLVVKAERHAVLITSGLPNGCAAFERIDVRHQGQHFDIRVWNTMPTDPRIACTMIYRSKEHAVELGSKPTAGRKYRVTINDTTRLDFIAR